MNIFFKRYCNDIEIENKSLPRVFCHDESKVGKNGFSVESRYSVTKPRSSKAGSQSILVTSRFWERNKALERCLFKADWKVSVLRVARGCIILLALPAKGITILFLVWSVVTIDCLESWNGSLKSFVLTYSRSCSSSFSCLWKLNLQLFLLLCSFRGCIFANFPFLKW